MTVRWTRAASGHLEEIGDYIARDNSAAAGAAVERIIDQADKLADHPHIGRAGRVPGTRELVISGTPYILAYRVTDGLVEVLAVFHGARRWPDKFV